MSFTLTQISFHPADARRLSSFVYLTRYILDLKVITIMCTKAFLFTCLLSNYSFTANTESQNGMYLRENSGLHFSDGEITQLASFQIVLEHRSLRQSIWQISHIPSMNMSDKTVNYSTIILYFV